MADDQQQNPNPQDVEQPAAGGEQAAQAQPAESSQATGDGAPQAQAPRSGQPADQRQPALEEVIAHERAKLQQGLSDGAGAQGAEAEPSPSAEQASGVDEGQASGSTDSAAPPWAGADLGAGFPAGGRKIKLSVLHVAVLLNTTLMMFAVGGLFYVLSGAGAKRAGSDRPQTRVVVVKTSPGGENTAAGAAAPSTQPTQPVTQPVIGGGRMPAGAVSWQQAEAAFAEKNYREALVAYGRMLEVLQQAPAEALVGQLCQFRTVQCLIQLGRGGEARELLAGLLTSVSPIIRAAANYEAASMDLQHGQYMQARMKLYAASACLGALEAPSGLERDCDFQIARALTQEAMAFFNNVTAVEWQVSPATDPFLRLDPHQLRKLLGEGAERLAESAVGPLVWRIEGGSVGRQWIVVCVRSPLEEVLSRFAAETNLDVRWVGVDPEVRRRPVTLLLSGVSEQRFAEVCCGVCGLVARLTGEEVIVHNPGASATVSAQRDLLVAEAVSAWRRFSLRASDDSRVPQGYFALAALEAAVGDSVAALRDAQLAAERFPGSKIAPLSLLLGARIRIQLRDYNGARTELLRLLNRYPDCPLAEQAYVHLGNVTAGAGLLEEAVRVFNKLYYLNISAESQVRACLGLGECFYRLGQFDQAADWLERCLRSPVGLEEAQLAQARMLLGQSAVRMGNLPRAQRAFQDVLSGLPPKNVFVDAGLRLSEVYLKEDKAVAALGILRGLDTHPLDDRQRQELFLLTALALRDMGLPERAAGYIRGKIDTSQDVQAQTRLSMELARCLADDGDLSGAQAALAEAIAKSSPGPVAQEAACYLAEIALKMGKLDQAVAVARELLTTSCPKEIRRRALEILGAACILQRDYRKAAEAYSEMLATKSQEATAQ